MAYFLMVGDTKGITTDYKRMADGNREIPLSSCPHFIEERLYGGGAAVPTEEDEQYLQQLKEVLDERAPHKTLTTAKKKARTETRYDRIKKFERNGKPKRYIYCSVDTDGYFVAEGRRYLVSPDNTQYAGKETKAGMLYDQDHVTVAVMADGSLRFFDTAFYPLDEDVLPQH